MGVRITTDENKAAIFDSVTGWAFGPVFDTAEDAEDFLKFFDANGIGPDPRAVSAKVLESAFGDWLNCRRRES